MARTNRKLHGFQKELVDLVNTGSNHIIVAPTGSGKTRIAVELAGMVLQRKPAARVLFLTSTVALAEQQTGKRCICTYHCDITVTSVTVTSLSHQSQ